MIIVVLPDGTRQDVESAKFKTIFLDTTDDDGERGYIPVEGGQVSWKIREGALLHRYGCHANSVEWKDEDGTTVCIPDYGQHTVIHLETAVGT